MPTMIMPKMGDGMEEGTLLRWLKTVGEEIEVGDPIAEIETDKVSLEIEATDGGTLTQTMVGEGETVPIGTPIALIGEEAAAEAAPPAQPEAATAAAAPAAVATPANAETAAVDPAAAQIAAGDQPAQAASAPTRGTTGEAATAAPSRAAGANGAADSGPAAPSTDSSAESPAVERAPGERLRASPLVKRLAAEHGLDLAGIPGTGPGGRIVKDDVMPYVNGSRPMPTAQPTATPAPSPEEQPAGGTAQPVAAPEQGASAAQPARPAAAAPSAGGRPAGVAKEMSRIRRTTGRRMTESKTTIPHFYVVSEVDMGPAAAFREQVNAQVTDEATKVSFNDLIVKAAALALREYPNLNTTLEGDTLYTHENIDVNVAVAIEGGLIAPFVADADVKSLGAIARTTKDVIARARKGGLEPAEYQGGTFTVSNLGMYDVEEFVAIINPPQAAILAIGSIAEKAVVVDGELVAGRRMKVTLSADHRVTDGAEVAQFLMRVKAYLENPMLLALS